MGWSNRLWDSSGMAQVDKQVGSAIRQFLLQCMTPKDFENITNRTLYIFSDASQSGYGQCSYVRSVNDRDLRHLSRNWEVKNHTTDVHLDFKT